MRIQEINARLAVINAELATATGEALAALEAEVDSLIAERTALEGEIQRRQQLRTRVATGVIGRTIEQPAGDPAPAAFVHE